MMADKAILKEVILGDCRLILGDCLEVMKEMPDGSVDAVITDPPYGIGANNMRLGIGKDLRYGNWDTADTHLHIQKILSYSIPTIIWGGNYFVLPKSEAWIIWDKKNDNLSFAEAELAWTNLGGKIRIIRYFAPGMDGGKQHNTQKPELVMRYCAERIPKECGVIFDPFMGSGTTGVACVQTGRKFIGIEIDPKYFEIAVKRIKDAQQQMRLPI